MKEAYVKPETAQLLKEKGFDWEVRSLYGNYQQDLGFSSWSNNYNAYDDLVSAPTQQMACRWLREEHNIHIMPTIGCDVDRTPRIFYGAVIASFNKNGDICYHNPLDENGYNEPEDAVEAALQYTLTNLI